MVNKKRSITTRADSSTGAYSPVVSVGDFVFVSGQGPLKPESRDIIGVTIEEQTQQTLQNVQRVLAAANCDLNDCVKLSVYLADMNDFDRYDNIYKTFFQKPFPARTTVQAKLWGGILVEIDAIAIRNCSELKS